MASETKGTTPTDIVGDGSILDEGRQVLDDAAKAVERAAAQVPAAVDDAARALNESARRLDQSTDETLTIGAALSTGLALGLYIGGANRILVTLALVPALAMVFTLLGRQGRALRTS